MANSDTPMGAKPVGHLQGLDWNSKVNWYVHLSTDAQAIYLGDIVKLTGTADTTGVYQVVAQAAAGDTALVGVAVGFRTDPPLNAPAALAGSDAIPRNQNYAPASTTVYVAVADDPYTIFEMQEDGNLGYAAVGSNFDLVRTQDGSTTTGLSGMEIDSDGGASSSTANLRVIGLADPLAYGGNTVGTNAKWRVLINEHVYKSTTGV